MPRYIDTDELKVDYFVPSTSTGTVNTQYVSLFQILNAPTADVQEVIRCKDCKHRHQTTCPFLIANAYKTSSDEDFCSMGERRCDGNNGTETQ